MYGPYGGAFADSGLFPYILTCMGRTVEHLQNLVYISAISLYVDMYVLYGGSFADSGLFRYLLACMGRTVEQLQPFTYFLIY